MESGRARLKHFISVVFEVTSYTLLVRVAYTNYPLPVNEYGMEHWTCTSVCICVAKWERMADDLSKAPQTYTFVITFINIIREHQTSAFANCKSRGHNKEPTLCVLLPTCFISGYRICCWWFYYIAKWCSLKCESTSDTVIQSWHNDCFLCNHSHQIQQAFTRSLIHS
jgi:hypothetical protein